MVPLKYLSNFWRTFEMPLINCEVNIILTWSANCVIIYTNVENQIPTFTITETHLYVLVVTLPPQDNAKLLTQLKPGFKRAISWNKYLSKPDLLAQNIQYTFSFGIQKWCTKISNKRYYLPNVEMKDYNVMIHGKKLNQPVKANKVTNENIRKIATGQGNDYTTSSLLDYIYSKNYYEMLWQI